MLINKTSTRYRDAYLKKKNRNNNKKSRHKQKRRRKENYQLSARKKFLNDLLTSTVSQHYVLHLKRVQGYKFQGNRKMLHF